ncbi:uncharacterized protein LOC117795990 isoform X2 [Ailuropoda melanoleuca]|uniref:uncharacterized protein LOC117795990 isoform X2 n=1 Tax=Ailuropoda melanoleuca TaxID=9646 RepID=UPI0014940B07|nr:uncharacterized protein LOC117795990 isoform X2 [Ailuropoda melanoleuca]
MERPIHRVRGCRRPQEPPPPIVHAAPQSWGDPPPPTAAAAAPAIGPWYLSISCESSTPPGRKRMRPHWAHEQGWVDPQSLSSAWPTGADDLPTDCHQEVRGSLIPHHNAHVLRLTSSHHRGCYHLTSLQAAGGWDAALFMNPWIKPKIFKLHSAASSLKRGSQATLTLLRRTTPDCFSRSLPALKKQS